MYISDRRGVVLSLTESKSLNKSQSRDTVISNKGFEVSDAPVNQVMCNNIVSIFYVLNLILNLIIQSQFLI